MRWMLNLDGGPRRVNHAAVAIGDKIYSFGGYSANEALDSQGDFIDVHVLNTFTYRWERLPTFPESDSALEMKSALTKQRSVTIAATGENNAPSTSNQSSSAVVRRRARSLSDLHPLAQIRATNPPLEDTALVNKQRHLQLPATSSSSSSNGLVVNPTLCLTHHRQQLRRAAGQQQSQNAVRDRIIAEEADEEAEDGQQQWERGANARQRIRELFNQIDADLVAMGSDESDEDYQEEDESTGSLQAMEEMGTIEEDEQMLADYEDDEPMELEEYEEDDTDYGNPIADLVLLAKLHQHPEIPFKRYGHTVVSYKGLIYLWGGRNDKLGCNQKLHRYNPAENRWAVVPTEGQCPPDRDGHTAVVDGDSMYIFGGFEEKEHRFSQETYALHFPSRTWRKLKSQGDSPQYRDFHAACVLDGKMYIFGGRSDEMGQMHTSHDVYCDKLHYFDLKTHRWHQPEITTRATAAPCGRRSHTMWTYQGAIYLFGGYQSIRNVHFNDLWRFNPTTSSWSKLMPTGQGPSPRRRQCTVLFGSRIFLFGGTMPLTNRRNQLSDLGDLYVLDFTPSLASLCSQAILENGMQIHAEYVLPAILTKELHYMSTPNGSQSHT